MKTYVHLCLLSLHFTVNIVTLFASIVLVTTVTRQTGVLRSDDTFKGTSSLLFPKFRFTLLCGPKFLLIYSALPPSHSHGYDSPSSL